MSSKKKCSKGKIEVSRFIRKNSLKTSVVEPYCRKDVGAPGKTPEEAKTLPKPTEKYFSLSRMGYSAYNNNKERREVLEKASRKFGDLPVLRHLNFRANYQQWNKEAYDRMKEDVDYLSEQIFITKK